MEKERIPEDIFIWFNYKIMEYQIGVYSDFIASGENLNEVADFAPILRFNKDKIKIATRVTQELNEANKNETQKLSMSKSQIRIV